jgi:hypothetical protein
VQLGATEEAVEPVHAALLAEEADAAVQGLANAVTAPQAILPEQVYATPQRVWLKLPEGIAPTEVQLYYYQPLGEMPGWYPAAQVEGWLVPDSYLHLRQDGATYFGFLVRHAGLVQLVSAGEGI